MDKDDVIGGATFLVAICVILAAVGGVIATMFGYSVITLVGAGETGVKFNLLADGVQDDEFGEGIHLKAPWVKVDKFNVRTQEYTDSIRTVTEEGLYVNLDITVLYRIIPTKADVIRQTIGKDGSYQSIVVVPTGRNAVREIISQYDAMDIYGEKRAIIEKEMSDIVTEQLYERHIIVEKLLIRDVGLPEELTKAIEAKKTSEQEALRMEYVLDKEALERDRKIIEAEGISGANEIIAGSLTTEYLTWYWIDNLDTHDSVIYVPVGDAGLPMFREVNEGTCPVGEIK
jgi:regulator of protease activity HflC (stomatin/prohibitin superfamily)